MKNILFIATFFTILFVSAQSFHPKGHVDGPMTTAQINAIPNPFLGQTIYNSETETDFQYNGSMWVNTGSGGGGTWGSITGTLSDQTDLQSALDSKLGSGDNVSELVNDAGYITDADVGGIVASGTFALTASSTNTITHGLGYAPDPSRIKVVGYRTGTVSPSGTSLVVGNITTTTFDIPVGSLGDPLSASWAIFGSDNATPMTGSEIVSSIDTELGSADWQTDDQTAAEVPNTPSGDIAATNVQAAINELDDEKVANIIAGRTGDPVSAVMIQNEADYISDGDPGTNEIVFCRGCAPMQVGTSATIDIDKFRGYDDRAIDAATFTFDNIKAGAAILIEINRASDATYSGVTIAHTTGAFAANTRQLVTIFILPSGDVLRDYKDLE